MKKLYDLHIKGKNKKWSFTIELDPKYLQDYWDDGLEINELVNIIPEWWVNAGFSVRVWCFWQDLLNFNNPFKK